MVFWGHFAEDGGDIDASEDLEGFLAFLAAQMNILGDIPLVLNFGGTVTIFSLICSIWRHKLSSTNPAFHKRPAGSEQSLLTIREFIAWCPGEESWDDDEPFS